MWIKLTRNLVNLDCCYMIEKTNSTMQIPVCITRYLLKFHEKGGDAVTIIFENEKERDQEFEKAFNSLNLVKNKDFFYNDNSSNN